MKVRQLMMALTMLAVLVGGVAEAQMGDGGVGPRPGMRNKGGGGGQEPGVYQVVSVDTYAGTVQLRGADGSTASVKVPGDVYDISKLKSGDRIQVNFYVPDSMNPGLRAAGIWPIR
jgi:hypothetical protein